MSSKLDPHSEDFYDNLVVLTRWMATEGFTAAEVADVVEKPWKYADWLAIAQRGGSVDELGSARLGSARLGSARIPHPMGPVTGARVPRHSVSRFIGPTAQHPSTPCRVLRVLYWRSGAAFLSTHRDSVGLDRIGLGRVEKGGSIDALLGQ